MGANAHSQSPSTAEVIRAVDELRTQYLGDCRIKELIMDNGSCFTSAAMKEYIISINTKGKFRNSAQHTTTTPEWTC